MDSHARCSRVAKTCCDDVSAPTPTHLYTPASDESTSLMLSVPFAYTTYLQHAASTHCHCLVPVARKPKVCNRSRFTSQRASGVAQAVTSLYVAGLKVPRFSAFFSVVTYDMTSILCSQCIETSLRIEK